MAVIAVIIGTLPILGAVWLAVMHSDPGLAQSPTPDSTMVTPTVSTASPSQVIVTPLTNVAESTTQPISTGNDSSGVRTGVMAGIAAAAAVLFAGIAYRLARGRPRAG